MKTKVIPQKTQKEVFNHKVEHLFLYKVVSNGDVPLSGVAWS